MGSIKITSNCGQPIRIVSVNKETKEFKPLGVLKTEEELKVYFDNYYHPWQVAVSYTHLTLPTKA